MNRCTTLATLIVSILLLTTKSLWADEDRYWQCTTSDSDNKQWVAKSIYERAATSKAFDACKKQSRVPASCKTDPGVCAGFDHGVRVQASWKCTALDQNANPWIGYAYSQDDAAIAAKTQCKQHSSVAESCYINLLTCSSTRS